jgi:hypothetical protein
MCWRGGRDMRKSVTLGIVFIIYLIALLAVDRTAIAQGSTGGTIGKTDKSASGGEQADEPRDGKRSADERAKTRSRRSESVRIVGPKTFQNPTTNGIRVDRCLGNIIEGLAGTGCGAPAADVWCHSKGLSRSISFTEDTASPTYRLGEHSICRAQPCSAFGEIVCE